MEVITDVGKWKEKAIVATVGFFDGVHPGHRFLIETICRFANQRKIPSAVITFPVHPRVVLQSDYQPKLLNSFEEKLNLLSQTAVDYTIVMDFSPELSNLSARKFMEDVLASQWNVKTLFIGYDHRFGRSRAEDAAQYVAFGKACGIEVLKAPSYKGNGGTVSSSVIRHLIENGDVKSAFHILGYNYSLKGRVVEGHQIGRSIGFPTANIVVGEPFKIMPKTGSYAAWVTIEKTKYKGMLYIGDRPTLNDDNRISIEANIFDFTENIYEKNITVEFIEFIREDMKFFSLEELKVQLQEDKLKVSEILD